LAVFLLAPFCYALLNVLSQLSKEEDGSYAYSMPSVVLLAEFVKLCLSMIFLSRELGLTKAVQTIFTRPYRWFLFAVPSVLYAVNNNLDMLNNMYMDPATESVLVQLKILTTALAWRLVFGSAIGGRKWMSLFLLFCGCGLAALPSDGGKASATMYIEPFGVVLIMFYVCISATAGVYNEWLYKSIGADESIHISNIRIYTVGVLFCLSTHLSTGGANPLQGGLVKGYNAYTWALVATYSVMGLLLAQVMKYFDNIVKLFISGSSMYASAFLTVVIFKRYPSAMFTASLALVSAAQVGYNWERIVATSSRRKSE